MEIDLAVGVLDDGDPLDIIECVGDFEADFLAAAALDSESEPESHASSSPQSFVEDIDHLDGAWTPLRMCGRAGGAVIRKEKKGAFK